MYVILIYDIEEKRVGKILKTCRMFLNWVQNSVFEGEITDANLMLLKRKLQKKIVPERDSVIIYEFRTTKFMKREILGQEKQKLDNII